MRELLVVLRDPSHLEALRALVAVAFFTELSNVAIVYAPDDIIPRIEALPGVISVEESKVGSFQV